MLLINIVKLFYFFFSFHCGFLITYFIDFFFWLSKQIFFHLTAINISSKDIRYFLQILKKKSFFLNRSFFSVFVLSLTYEKKKLITETFNGARVKYTSRKYRGFFYKMYWKLSNLQGRGVFFQITVHLLAPLFFFQLLP